MPAWDVKPPGVQGVVTRTEGALQDLLAEGAAIQDAATAAETAAASPAVGGAIGGFRDARVVPAVAYSVERGAACATAAVQATEAYVQGQFEMAANAQAAAAAAPDPRATMPGFGGGR
ncbi:DUF6507 family protein [Saccharothrix xinjiangensis]|uniref:DUF6507 family protein n=1 Tax=Saccharothrix xinjiangensis TaxID=204798 RepID=A0ABV9Y8L4_9PSEU